MAQIAQMHTMGVSDPVSIGHSIYGIAYRKDMLKFQTYSLLTYSKLCFAEVIKCTWKVKPGFLKSITHE